MPMPSNPRTQIANKRLTREEQRHPARIDRICRPKTRSKRSAQVRMLQIVTLRSKLNSLLSSTARLMMARVKSKSRTKGVGRVLLSAKLKRNLSIARNLKLLSVLVRIVRLRNKSKRSEARILASSLRRTNSNQLRSTSSPRVKTVKPNNKLLHNQMRLLKLSKQQPLRPRSSNVRCVKPSSRRRSS